MLAVASGLVYLATWIAGAQGAGVGAVAGLFTSLAWIVAAGLIGVSVLRRGALPPPAHALPLVIAVGTVALFVAFGLVSNFHGPAWLEVPVVLVGAAWAVLGAALWPPPVTPAGSRDVV